MTSTGQFHLEKSPATGKLRGVATTFLAVWTTNGQEVKQQRPMLRHVGCGGFGTSDTTNHRHSEQHSGPCRYLRVPNITFSRRWLSTGQGLGHVFVVRKSPQSNIAMENQHCSTLPKSNMAVNRSPTAKLDSTK